MTGNRCTNKGHQRGDAEIAMVFMLLLAAVFAMGFLLAEVQTTSACKDFGKFSSVGKLYECKQIEVKK